LKHYSQFNVHLQVIATADVRLFSQRLLVAVVRRRDGVQRAFLTRVR